MSSVTVKPGQTLADVAVQHLGSEEGVYELAQLNELSLTAVLTAGQQLELPPVVDKRAKAILSGGKHEPAAGEEESPGGIGVWIIEKDFVVS